jgi:uncharacterized membrane protein YqgA involved in biofilm formation
MAKKNTDIENIIKGAVIGAGLGYVFSGRKNSALLAAMAGAIIGVGIEGVEQAKKANLPIVSVENGWLIEILPNGTKRKLEQLPPKKKNNLPQRFEL